MGPIPAGRGEVFYARTISHTTYIVFLLFHSVATTTGAQGSRGEVIFPLDKCADGSYIWVGRACEVYLSEDEGRERLAHPDNLSNVVVEIRKRTGRPAGSPRLSPAAREIVAQASRVLPPIEVAEAFGITRRTASNLSRGVTSNSSLGRQVVDVDLKSSVEKFEEDRTKAISSKALDILMATLGDVDPSKVKSQATKVKIAKDLAVIHEKMNGNGPQSGLTRVLIYAPKQREMKDYDVIDIPSQVVNR